MADAVLPADKESVSTDRAALDHALAEASDEKRKAKVGLAAGENTEFLKASRRILEIVEQMRQLQVKAGGLTEVQRQTWIWALYAVAVQTQDALERRRCSKKFIKALAKLCAGGKACEEPELRALNKIAWLGAKRIWKKDVCGAELRELIDAALTLAQGPMRGIPSEDLDPRHVFLRGLTVRLCQLEKGEGVNRLSIPLEIARGYTLLCSHWLGFFKKEDFIREKASPEAIRASQGRLRDFPSMFEKSMGLLHRCYKQYATDPTAGIAPSSETLEIARRNVDKGPWIGFYYGSWLLFSGKRAEARTYFADVVAAHLNESWAWWYLGKTFDKDDQAGIQCLSRALLCLVRDQEVSNGLSKKIHRELAERLTARQFSDEALRESALAISSTPLPGNVAFYRQVSKGVEKRLCTNSRKSFEGLFDQRPGQGFGFVRSAEWPIFVPPNILAKTPLSPGRKIGGLAEKSFDKKKNRWGWAAICLWYL